VNDTAPTEIYTSVQGEGPDAGVLTQFVRFAGCNLRCPGWPCDTEHAINPAKYRHEWKKVTPKQIKERVVHYLQPRHISITGGEPFLQPEAELTELVGDLLEIGRTFNVFTNGTLKFPRWVLHPHVKVIMDWKLPGSGEGTVNTYERLDNVAMLAVEDSVKFVCANRGDFIVAQRIVESHPNEFAKVGNIYIGAAWGKVKEAEVVEWLKAANNPRLKLNVQVHNYIWNREERGI